MKWYFPCRLTKERDLARTELEVCKHDLDKLEADLNIISGENERLKKDQQNSGSSSAVTSNGLEKGSKEILEAKENEIQKLSERVKSLESEVQMLKEDKSALEREKKELEKALQNGGQHANHSEAKDGDKNVDSLEKEKKIAELSEQIKIYKSELNDKQKEAQHEKQELQKVIEEMREELKKGGGSGTLPPEVEALNKELSKAKQEVKEAAVERERFQSQLEMLVQELEQKQVSFYTHFVDYHFAAHHYFYHLFIMIAFVFVIT